MSNILRYIPNSTVIEKDGRLFYGRQRSFVIIEDSGNIKVAEPSGLCPLPNQVLDGVVYGNETGVLGKINESDYDIAEQLENNLYTLIETFVDTTKYKKLDYMIDLEKNDFYSNAHRYGVLIEDDFQDLEETTFSRDVMELNFEIVLTNDWIDNADDDLGARNAAKELKKTMELIRRKVRSTRAGTYNTGNIQSPIDWTTDSPEYEEDNKLVILRAFFTIKYSIKK